MSHNLLAAHLLLAALTPGPSAPQADAMAECGFFYWSSIALAREQRDLESIQHHLSRLNRLARAVAIDQRISHDGAHAVLRRKGRHIRRSSGVNLLSLSKAGEACAGLERRLGLAVEG